MLKVRLDQGVTRCVLIRRVVRQGCCLSSIPFNVYRQYLTKESIKGFGDYKIEQVIRTVKYADDIVLLAKEETMLQGKYFIFRIFRYLIDKLNLENIMAWK